MHKNKEATPYLFFLSGCYKWNRRWRSLLCKIAFSLVERDKGLIKVRLRGKASLQMLTRNHDNLPCACGLSHVQLSATPWTVALLCPWDSPGKTTEAVAISSSRGSSWPRDQTHTSCISCIAGGFFTHWIITEAQSNDFCLCPAYRRKNLNLPCRVIGDLPWYDSEVKNEWGYIGVPFWCNCEGKWWVGSR